MIFRGKNCEKKIKKNMIYIKKIVFFAEQF